jgi:putative addiction module component (TIGR02574 family)
MPRRESKSGGQSFTLNRPLDENYPFGIIRWLFAFGKNAMDSNIMSVFDLTPPEKLQLVEDLWDDLAASPEVVPIHDWQKEELIRRKANLLNKPASGLLWEEVKKRIRSRHGR